MNLYEFNKIAMANFPDFKEEEFQITAEEFKDWFQRNRANKYFMMLNRENNYYTLFHIQSSLILKDVPTQMFSEICECLATFGTIISMDLTENKDAFEIWVKDNEDQTFMFLLFPYDVGVIKI